MTRSVDAVPDELADALRGAAAAVPGHPGDLDVVRRRVTARRRRQAAGTAVLSALVVAGSIGVPYALAGGAAPATVWTVRGAATSDPVPPAPPAQRLILSGAGGIMVPSGAGGNPDRIDPTKPNFGYPEGSSGVVSVGGMKELLPDGSVVTHPMGGSGGFGSVLLDDERIVALRSKDLAPGVQRTDGPCVTDLAILLEVYDGSGTPSLSRDIREVCQTVILVAASAEEAYLIRADADRYGSNLRSATLVAHRYSDGIEREIVGVDGLGSRVQDLNQEAGLAVSIVGREDMGCRLVALSLSSGQTVADHDVRARGGRGRVRVLRSTAPLAGRAARGADGGPALRRGPGRALGGLDQGRRPRYRRGQHRSARLPGLVREGRLPSLRRPRPVGQRHRTGRVPGPAAGRRPRLRDRRDRPGSRGPRPVAPSPVDRGWSGRPWRPRPSKIGSGLGGGRTIPGAGARAGRVQSYGVPGD